MRSNCKDEILKLSGRILVADEQFRNLLVRRAEKMGLLVPEVGDENEAMEALEGERFDLIVSDLHMPDHTGLEMISKAQEKEREIHAILLTAGATVERIIGWALE